MNQLKDFLDDEMDDEILEKFTEDIIYQKFDAENRQIYSKILVEKFDVVQEKKKHHFIDYFTWRRLSIAAVIIGLVFTVFLVTQSPPPENQMLAKQYIEEFPIIVNQSLFRKGGEVEVSSIQVQANEAYVKSDFDAAAKYWTILLEADQATAFDYFYLGLSTLRKKKAEPQKAIDYLLKAQPNAPELQQEINWLLSLAYLSIGQEEKAIPLLEKIISNNEYMTTSAKELMAAINKKNIEGMNH